MCVPFPPPALEGGALPRFDSVPRVHRRRPEFSLQLAHPRIRQQLRKSEIQNCTCPESNRIHWNSYYVPTSISLLPTIFNFHTNMRIVGNRVPKRTKKDQKGPRRTKKDQDRAQNPTHRNWEIPSVTRALLVDVVILLGPALLLR